MINDQLILRTFLAGDSAVTAMVSTRIYAGRDVPPEGWQPADGSCIVFKRRGERDLDERGQVISASYQVKAYGTGCNYNQQVLNCESLYRVLRERLNYGASYDILGIQRDGGAEILPEPDTGWPFVVSFWRVQFRKTA